MNRVLDMAVVRELAGIFGRSCSRRASIVTRSRSSSGRRRSAGLSRVPCDRGRSPRGSRSIAACSAESVAVQRRRGSRSAALKVVTRRAPTEPELHALRFAWRGQACEVEFHRADVARSGRRRRRRADEPRRRGPTGRHARARGGLATEGSVCASDAFFPFRDGLDVVAKAGATAVIQPGGRCAMMT